MNTEKIILDIITLGLIIVLTIDTLRSRKQLKIYDGNNADPI